MSSNFLVVRLRPVKSHESGARTFHKMKCPGFPLNFKFEETAGWYKFPAAIAEVLRHELDSAHKPVFDVMTHGESIALERAEEEAAAKRMSRAKAATPHTVNIPSAKRASDLAFDAPAPQPSRRPAPVAQPVPRAPAVEMVAPAEIDWDALGEEASEDPADSISDEADEDAAAALGIEAVGEVAPPAVEPEAPVRGPKPSKGNGKRNK
jgi:hypothetical protein